MIWLHILIENIRHSACSGVGRDLQKYLHRCWAVLCRYAMLGHEPGPMLLLAVARQALLQLDSFSPQELTNMVSQPPQSFLHIQIC